MKKKFIFLVIILFIPTIGFIFEDKIKCFIKVLQTKQKPITIPPLKSVIITDDGKIIAKSEILYRLYVLKKDKDKILSILKSQNIPVKTHNNSKYYDFVYHLFTKNDVEKLKKLLRKYAKDEKIGCFYYKNFYFAPFEEKRIYPQGKLFTPIEGITKVKTKNILIRVGVNGLEGADNSRENRVKSTLNYNFQQKITSLIDKRKNLDGSVKIVAVLINKNTGEILASVNTDRYDPNHITQKDIPYTKTDVNFYLFDRKPFIQKYYNLIDEKYKNENYEKIFELNKPSSDLPLERQEKGKFNFLQLIKFATPFTNGGYLVEPHYLKATPIIHKKIPFIADSYYEDIIKENPDLFYNKLRDEIYLKDLNMSVTFNEENYDKNLTLYTMNFYKYKIGYKKFGNYEIYPKVFYKDYGFAKDVCSMPSGSCYIEVFLIYPLLKGNKYDKNINSTIKNYFKKLRKNTSYMIDYKANINDNIYSVIFEAKGMYADATNLDFWYKSFNFDLNTGKLLKLKDIFPNIKKLKQKVYKALLKKYPDAFSSDELKPQDLKLDNFYIGKNYIYFYFAQGELTANCFGTLEVKIKFKEETWKK
jgi:hypothetical protein